MDQTQTFTSKKASQFFTKSEYEHIGHDFNFEALGKLTDPKFAEEIEDKLNFCYMKKFVIEDRETCYFLYFYAQDFQKEDYRVIMAYHNKESYFNIDLLRKYDLDKLGLGIKGMRKK